MMSLVKLFSHVTLLPPEGCSSQVAHRRIAVSSFVWEGTGSSTVFCHLLFRAWWPHSQISHFPEVTAISCFVLTCRHWILCLITCECGSRVLQEVPFPHDTRTALRSLAWWQWQTLAGVHHHLGSVFQLITVPCGQLLVSKAVLSCPDSLLHSFRDFV
jgi:hypothetical protein